MGPKREHICSQIQALHVSCMSNTKTAQLGVDPKTVRLWVIKGDGNVSDSKRVGRPTKLTPNTRNKIRNLVKDKIGIDTRAVAKRLNSCKVRRQSVGQL